MISNVRPLVVVTKKDAGQFQHALDVVGMVFQDVSDGF
jgi:hypothetical protein